MKNNKCFFSFVICIMLFMISMPVMAKGGYIVKFQNGFKDIGHKLGLDEVYAKDGIYVTNDIYKLKEYEYCIEYIEENKEVYLIDDVKDSKISLFSDNYYDSIWQNQMINYKYPWEFEAYGNNVKIAIIDSGCNMHNDITGNIAGGYNYLKNIEEFSDNIGHGTHVAGIIASNGGSKVMTGIAPKAEIYALKCFDINENTGKIESPGVDTLARVIYSAVDDYDCKVINMSLGTNSNVNVIKDAIDHAAEEGAIIIAAVGNDGIKTLSYPAAYDNVIGVGSVGKTKVKSSFSRYNKSVFVVAPGESVYSLSGTDGYKNLTGTSQATPYVTAAAAICLSCDENMTADEFKNLIIQTSEDLGEAGLDEKYGYGLLNLEDLFKELLKSKNIYTSPINKDGVLILNNSDIKLSATAVMSKYDGDKYIGAELIPVELEENESIKINTFINENEVKFFLWDNTFTMNPLIKSKVCEKIK